MEISEPGVMAPAPFAQVYSPAPPPMPSNYYPPPFPAPPVTGTAGWDRVGYRSAGTAGGSRPGVITALGVTAIIVACLSFFASVFTGCAGVVAAANSKGRRVAAVRTTVPPRASGTTVTPGATGGVGKGSQAVTILPTGPDGLDAQDRALALRVMRTRLRHPLSAERQRQLEAFLAEHGQLIFDDSAGRLTLASVTRSLGQTGKEFAGGAAGQNGPDYFIIKQSTGVKVPGRLLVKDDGAVLRPDDRSEAISTYAGSDNQQQQPQAQVTGSGFEEDEASAIVARAQELSNNKVNPAQVAALTALMESPAGESYVNPASTIPGLTAQVRSTVVQFDGTTTVTFVMGKVSMDAAGNFVGPVAGPPMTTPTTGPTYPTQFWGNVSVSAGSTALVTVDAILSVMLAVYLMVIAILSLRPVGLSRRYFTVYACVKILLGAAAIVGFSWMIADVSNVSVPAIMSGVVEGWSKTSLVLTSIGIAYPVVMLIVLAASTSAREYYRTAV